MSRALDPIDRLCVELIPTMPPGVEGLRGRAAAEHLIDSLALPTELEGREVTRKRAILAIAGRINALREWA